MPSFNVHSELRFACATAPWLGNFRAQTVELVEALSQPFVCTIDFDKLPSVSFPTLTQIDALLDEECSFELGAGTTADTTRQHGIVRSVELLSATASGGAGVRVTIVPTVWRLSLTKRTRQFHAKSVKQIVETVLSDNGLAAAQDFEWRLQVTYPPREYTMQYDETDLAFVSRLLEWEGIFYYFEQGETRSKMVMTDKNEGCELDDAPATLTYHSIGVANSNAVVHSFETKRTLAPHKVRAYDYNYRLNGTAKKLDDSADVSLHGRTTTTGPGFELYGENLKSADDADRISTRRAQLITTQNAFCVGTSQVRSLGPGHTFGLSAHPMASLDGNYLVTEVRHVLRSSGTDDQIGYHNSFKVVPASQPFRPALSTPRPKIHGFIQGTIAGTETGYDAPIDGFGRYKVDLLIDQTASVTTRWTRVAQMTASSKDSTESFGMHWPLHVGAEVLVAFAQGDPDRPVIVGSVAAVNKPSPVNSAEPTRAIFRTKALVEIHLDDDA